MAGARHILAFDIYGTLLDTSAIAGVLSSVLSISADEAAGVALLWRRYQLE